jgi:hypothetical protein
VAGKQIDALIPALADAWLAGSALSSAARTRSWLVQRLAPSAEQNHAERLADTSGVHDAGRLPDRYEQIESSLWQGRRARPASCEGEAMDELLRKGASQFNSCDAMDDVGTNSSARARTLASYGGKAMDDVDEGTWTLCYLLPACESSGGEPLNESN